MIDADLLHDERLAEAMESIEAELSLGRPIDQDTWQSRYPDLAADLAGLVEIVRQFRSAVSDCRAGIGDTVVQVPGSDTIEHRPGTEPYEPTPTPIPPRVGRYEIIGQLGAGGMGTVYHARDPQLARDVAIKVPRFEGPAAARVAAHARFEREARAAAAVRQAHVCPIYDVGTWEGVPYVVMAYVEGKSLSELVTRGQVEPRRAVELVCQVADGLAAVHDFNIIHRDLKPANILLDQSGQALLTDFGLARYDTGGDRLTPDGSVMGTPAYMSPEQAALSSDEVGPTADIYSLGAVLYELITGQPPYRGNAFNVIYQISQQSPSPPSQLRLDLDPALEAIIVKAMARRPQDRYPTARAFATALRDWLAGVDTTTTEPARFAGLTPTMMSSPSITTMAPPPRRRRTLTAVLVGLLLAGSLVAGVALVGDRTKVEIVTDQGTVVVTMPETDVQVFIDEKQRTLESGKTVTLELKEGKHRLSVQRDGKELYGVDFQVEAGKPVALTAIWPPPLPLNDPLREIDRKSIPKTEPIESLAGDVVAVFGSHAWRWYAYDANSPSSVTFAFADNGRDVIALDLYGDGLWSPNPSPSGYRAKSWDAATGKILQHFPFRDCLGWTYLPQVRAVAQYAREGSDLTWKLWSIDTGKEMASLPRSSGHDASVIAASPNGKLIATLLTSSGPDLWDLKTNKHLAPLPLAHRPEANTFDYPYAAAFSGDSKRLAVVYHRNDGSGHIEVFDVVTRKAIHSEPLPKGSLNGVYPNLGFTSDAGGIVIATQENNAKFVQVWDLVTKTWRRELKLHLIHHDDVWAISGVYALSPDGKTIAIANGLYDATSGKELIQFDGPKIQGALAFSPDGKRVVGAGSGGAIVVYDTTRGKLLSSPPAPEFRFLAVSADGRVMAVPEGNTLLLVETVTGKDRATVRGAPGVTFTGAILSPDGSRLVAGPNAYDAVSGQFQMTLPSPSDWYARLAFSGDGTQLVRGARGPERKIWDTLTWNELPTNKIKYPLYWDVTPGWVAHSPDGSLVAILKDQRLSVTETNGGKERFTTGDLGGPSLAFSPDGTRLLSSSLVYHTATGKKIVELKDQKGLILGQVFSPDGKTIFGFRGSSQIVCCSASDGKVLKEWQLGGPINRIALTANGRYLFTSNANGTVYVLRVNLPQEQAKP